MGTTGGSTRTEFKMSGMFRMVQFPVIIIENNKNNFKSLFGKNPETKRFTYCLEKMEQLELEMYALQLELEAQSKDYPWH